MGNFGVAKPPGIKLVLADYSMPGMDRFDLPDC